MSKELSRDDNDNNSSSGPNIETYKGMNSTVSDFTRSVHAEVATATTATTKTTNLDEPALSPGSRGGDTDSIDAASRKAFGSVALFLQSELEASGSELSLLEKLNDASITKYEELSCQAQDMLVHGYKIKQTYNEMEAQMAEVDSLVASIDSLEQVSQELDRYSQQLEAKFQNLLR